MTTSLPAPAGPASVAKAHAADADVLARTLARAFHDEPVSAWFFPAERGRLARLERFFRVMVLERSVLPHDAVYATQDGSGAALWLPPGEAGATTWEQVRMLPELVRLCRRDIVRGLRGMATLDRHHPTEDHWFLWFVGVAPERQGAGLGSALMRPVLDRCDAEGAPAYLDATTRQSMALYERHGFEVTGELRLPGGGPTIWPMWREPRGA